MLNPQCATCIWSGQCFSASRCDDYYPTTPEAEESVDSEMMARHRAEYHEDWNEAVERRIFFA